MKRFIALFLAGLILGSVALVGCPGKGSPTNPGGSSSPTPTLGSPIPTATPTETALCSPYYSFGRSAVGSASGSFGGNDLFCNSFNLTVPGSLYRLHAYVPSAPSAGASVQMAVYSNNAGAPQSLLVSTSVQAAVQGWNTFDIPVTVLAVGTYWIGLASGSTGIPLAYGTGSSGDTQYISASPGSLPASITSTSVSDWDFSYYADYCVGAGTATPLPTITPTPTPTNSFTLTPTNSPTPLNCAGGYSFGKNFISGGSNVYGTGYIFGTHFTLTTGGSVTMLHAYVQSVPTPGGSIQMALYDNSSPHNLLTQSNAQAMAAGWNNFPVPASGALAPGTYWIILTTTAPGGVGLSSDSTGNTGDGMSYSGSIANPSAFTANNDWSFSFYADYCVGAGTPTPVRTPTLTYTFTVTPTNTPTNTQTPVPACNGSYSAGSNWPLSAHGVFNNYGYMFCNAITLSAGGNVTMLHFLSAATPSAGVSFQMALYTSGGGAPQSLLTSSNSQAPVSGVNSAAVPATLVGPGVYWVVTMPAYNTGIDFYDDYPGPPSNGGYWMSNSGTFPAVSSGGADQGYRYSMWADYCVVAGSPTPVPTVTWTFTPSFTATFTPTVTQTPVCGSPSYLGITTTHTGNSFGGGYVLATRFNLAASATITGLNINITGFTAPTTVQMAVYSNAVSHPNGLIVQSNLQAAVTGWNNFQVPQVGVAGPATLWIAVSQSNYGYGIGIGDQSPGTTDGFENSFTFGSFPATFPAGGSNWDNTLDVYLDKCP